LISTTDFNREMMELVTSGNTGKIERPTQEELKGAPPLSALGSKVPTSPARVPNGTNVSRATPPPAKKAGSTENMVIPPWSKQSGTGGQLRKGTHSASLRKEMDEQSNAGPRNIVALLVILVVGMVVAARQYGLLGGTPLEFLSPTQQVAKTQPVVPDRSPAAQPAKPVAPVTEGVVVLQSQLKDLRVLVNGKAVATNNNQFNIPLNTLVTIGVSKRGYQPVQFQATAPNRNPLSFKVELVELPSGSFTLTTTPESRVTIFSGEEIFLQARTPIRNERLPVGRYRVLLENSILNYKGEIEVVIEQGKHVTVDRLLK
jgi:hypothetical protein